MSYKDAGAGYSTGYNKGGMKDVSTFNSGYFKIVRLNNCWANINIHWRAGNFDKLNWELDIIWAEFWCDADTKEKKDITDLDKEITKAKDTKEKIAWIREKWLRLFEIEKGQGLGKKYYDESQDEFD